MNSKQFTRVYRCYTIDFSVDVWFPLMVWSSTLIIWHKNYHIDRYSCDSTYVCVYVCIIVCVYAFSNTESSKCHVSSYMNILRKCIELEKSTNLCAKLLKRLLIAISWLEIERNLTRRLLPCRKFTETGVHDARSYSFAKVGCFIWTPSKDLRDVGYTRYQEAYFNGQIHY